MTISQITKAKSTALAEYRTALDEAHTAAVALSDRTVTLDSVVGVWSGLEQCIRTMNENKASERYLTGLDKGKREAVDMVWNGWKAVEIGDWLLDSPSWYAYEQPGGHAMQYEQWQPLWGNKKRIFASAADVYRAFRCLYDVFAPKIETVQQRPGISPPHTWADFWADVVEWRGDANSAGGRIVETIRRIRTALSKYVVCDTTIVGYQRASDGDKYEAGIVHGGSRVIQPYDDMTDAMLWPKPIVELASSLGHRQQLVKRVFRTNDSLEDITAVLAFVSGTPVEKIEFQGYTMPQEALIRREGKTCVMSMGHNPQTGNFVISCATPFDYSGVSFGVDPLKRAVYEHKKERRQ